MSQASLDAVKMRADRAVAGVANAQASIAVAQANARNAQVAVDYTMIRAPFDGVIVSKAANVGDMVTPFSSAVDSKGAVVSMVDMSTLEVEADVSESSLAKIKVGQPCEITLDALPDVRFRGRISRMVPTVDRAKATVVTKVRFDAIDPRILPDMSAKVSFLTQEVTAEQQKPLLAVHPDALAVRDGATVLFVVRDGKLAQVPVVRGATLGDRRRHHRRGADGGEGRAEAVRRIEAGNARSSSRRSNAGRDPHARCRWTIPMPRSPRPPTAEPLVAIRELTKFYVRGDQVIPVLVGINLDIHAGDYVALMGPSGSGKSTLLNLIAGIDKPTSGRIHVAGVDIAQLSEADLAAWRAASVGFIFQFYNLMPVLSAFDNVELPLLLTSLSRRDRRERVETALSLVGLADRMEHYPNELSGGQQQRVAIARALIGDPTLIVADEPTGDLDRATAEEILQLLERLNREVGKTIVMVTHDPKAAEKAHRVIHLEKGVLVP